MAPGPDQKISARRTRRRQARLIAIAKLALFWERLWPRLWPPLGVLALLTAIALFDVLPLLPYWMHVGVLVLGALALLVGIVRGVRGLHATDRHDAVRRVERDSELQHRPLAALDDTCGVGADDRVATALWRVHRARVAAAVGKLRVALPSPGMARRDPLGLRAAALLILVAGVFIGGGEARERLNRALFPATAHANAMLRIDLWVTPPAYTGYTPFHLSTHNKPATSTPQEVRGVPVGSTVLAQVGSDDAPVLDLAGRFVGFDPISIQASVSGSDGTGGYHTQARIGAHDMDAGGQAVRQIAVRFGSDIAASWPVRIIDDTPPTVAFMQPPGDGGHGRLRVSFVAEDDFGLRAATLVIRNPDLPPDSGEGDTVRLDLPLTSTRARSIDSTVVRDLSEHDWAGLPVEARLEATDALGQIGRSDVLSILLPQRTFNHPVARALVDLRKRLVTASHESLIGIIDGLDTLAANPLHFNEDNVVYLAITVARSRLNHDGSHGARKSVRALLWQTALRIEDGEFAMARREFSDVQDALMEAMRDGAFGEDMDALMDALSDALDRFMAAVSEELNDQGLDGLSDLPGLTFLDKDDLQQMIRDARELARTGSLDAAQAALDELRSMVQSIESALNSNAPLDQLEPARKMLQSLSDVSRAQEDLLDKTFSEMRRQRGLEPSPVGPRQRGMGTEDGTQPQTSDTAQATRDHGDEQDALRRKLGDLMTGLDELLGTIPEPLGEAERAMQRATRSLKKGDAKNALPAQSDALEALRRTAEEVAQSVAKQMRGMPGNAPGAQGTLPSPGSDPFGRSGGGAVGSQLDDGSVQVPDQMEIRRAREIYDELRRRAGDIGRSGLERDYIDRLLRQF